MSAKVVCFYGFGLIGASLAAALKQADPSVVVRAVVRSESTLKEALRLGLCDQADHEAAPMVSGADVVVLAVPVQTTFEALQRILPHVSSQCVITDVGSTKISVIEAAAKAYGGTVGEQFVPAHPIAGSERSGVSAYDPNLYQERMVIITPLEHSSKRACALVETMWQQAGAVVVSMEPKLHDQVLARTSHLPHLLAFNLVEQLASRPDNLECFRYAAGGFRDFTRIAASDPVMWRDIFMANKQAVLEAIGEFEGHLTALKTALQQDDSDTMLGVFTRARAARKHFDHMLNLSRFTEETSESMNQSFVCAAAAKIQGSITVPGDKSISHRSIMFGALADGVSRVSNFLEGEDALATLQAFRDMGVVIEGPERGKVVVHGVGLNGLKPAPNVLYMGNSGTSMRLLSGILAAQGFDSVMTGDASLSKRPMERAAAPLRLMGANIQTTGEKGTPPVSVQAAPQGLSGIHYNLPVASAQVKSAVLLAGLWAKGTTSVTEPEVTRDHTERMLRAFGAKVTTESEAGSGVSTIRLEPPEKLSACDIQVPSDISSAAFFMVAAAIAPEADLTLKAVGMNPTRTGVTEILKLMGARLEIQNPREVGGEPVADIRIQSSQLKGIKIPEHLVPLAIDEFPALFVAASCAEGVTTLTGAAELRVKESDRIAVMAEGLQALGVECTATPDGMVIQGNPNQQVFGSAEIDSHHDHRIAMSFAVAAIRSSGQIKIQGTQTVATSFPNFVELATEVGMQLEVA